MRRKSKVTLLSNWILKYNRNYNETAEKYQVSYQQVRNWTIKYDKSGVDALIDRRGLISYVIGHSNNNALVFETFDLAVASYPDAKPIFHSDRGFQYTNKAFKAKLDKAGMT